MHQMRRGYMNQHISNTSGSSTTSHAMTSSSAPFNAPSWLCAFSTNAMVVREHILAREHILVREHPI